MKLNYKRTLLVGFAFLSISTFWQMYDSIIPLILQNTFQIGEAATGRVMAIDNILACFPCSDIFPTTPIQGSASAPRT